MFRLIFLGAPGVGKGTQAAIFAKNNNLVHISTGAILREEIAKGSELGLELKPIVEKGELAPDGLLVRLVEKRIAEDDCANGYILDGFPRTLKQAIALDELFTAKNITLPQAVSFEISEENLLARLENRRNSGENRVDDTIEVQKNRLKVYKELTEPLIDYYKNKGALICVDGNADVEEVQKRLINVLS